MEVSHFNISDFFFNFLLYIVLQKPPTMSQLASLTRKFIDYSYTWITVALYLGISFPHCDDIASRYTYKGFCNYTRCSLCALSDWLDRKRGTGDLPRTRETVLNAFKKYLPSHIASVQRTLMED